MALIAILNSWKRCGIYSKQANKHSGASKIIFSQEQNIFQNISSTMQLVQWGFFATVFNNSRDMQTGTLKSLKTT